MEVGGERERESVLEQPSERRERRAGWERMYFMRASSAAEIFFIDGKKCRRHCFFCLFWVRAHMCYPYYHFFVFVSRRWVSPSLVPPCSPRVVFSAHVMYSSTNEYPVVIVNHKKKTIRFLKRIEFPLRFVRVVMASTREGKTPPSVMRSPTQLLS